MFFWHSLKSSIIRFSWKFERGARPPIYIPFPSSSRTLQGIYLSALLRLPLKLERGARSRIYLPFPSLHRTLQEIYPSGGAFQLLLRRSVLVFQQLLRRPSLESFRPPSDVETSSNQASLESVRPFSDVVTSSKQAFLERFAQSMCALLLVP